MKPKILLITYHFPPSRAVGGLRMANFARHLPNLGWDVSVLTIKDRYLDGRDELRNKNTAGLNVYKTPKLITVSDLYLSVKRLFRKPAPNIHGKSIEPAYAPSGNPKSHTENEGLTQRMRRYLFSLILCLPDAERNWVIPAIVRALAIIRKENVNFILTSCPPFSVHLIGLVLKMLVDVKWIADFRDP